MVSSVVKPARAQLETREKAGINHRVKQALDTVTKIVSDTKLMRLHAREMKCHNTAHLRIRVDVLLTRPEINQLREELADAVQHYPRVIIDNAEWSNRWFSKRQGLEVKLFFEPYSKELARGVWRAPEWWMRANPRPPKT